MTKIILFGGLGRLGQSILHAAMKDSNVSIHAVVGSEESLKQGDSLAAHGVSVTGKEPALCSLSNMPMGGDVVIDSTRGDSVGDVLAWTMGLKLPYVLGATGYSSDVENELHEASKTIPVLLAPNFSWGITVMNELVRMAARSFPQSEVEMVEAHHKHKKDAPSGTTIQLAKTIQSERPKAKIRENLRRSPDDIVMHSVRGGDIVAEQTVTYIMDGERFEISHRASSRDIFAKGAIKAASFLVKQKPGLYEMKDVLDQN